MILCGILYALMALVPCQATFYLGGIGYGLSLGFSYPVLTVLTVQGRRRAFGAPPPAPC